MRNVGYLTTGTTMYCDMDMRFCLEKGSPSALPTRRRGFRAPPRRIPAALAGPASDALSFGRAVGGVAEAGGGGPGRGGGTQDVARTSFYVPSADTSPAPPRCEGGSRGPPPSAAVRRLSGRTLDNVLGWE
jgi:hypothetical protein